MKRPEIYLKKEKEKFFQKVINDFDEKIIFINNMIIIHI